MVPADVAAQVTKELTIPTVGIGAGVDCDAQVLVWPDMAGLTGGKVPRFVKRYADLRGELLRAAREYADDVRSGTFPAPSTPSSSRPASAALPGLLAPCRRCTTGTARGTPARRSAAAASAAVESPLHPVAHDVPRIQLAPRPPDDAPALVADGVLARFSSNTASPGS